MREQYRLDLDSPQGGVRSTGVCAEAGAGAREVAR
jgi:hypothetical protein